MIEKIIIKIDGEKVKRLPDAPKCICIEYKGKKLFFWKKFVRWVDDNTFIWELKKEDEYIEESRKWRAEKSRREIEKWDKICGDCKQKVKFFQKLGYEVYPQCRKCESFRKSLEENWRHLLEG